MTSGLLWAQLLWYVQICDMIGSSQPKLEQTNEVSQNVHHELLIHLWNGPQDTVSEGTQPHQVSSSKVNICMPMTNYTY